MMHFSDAMVSVWCEALRINYLFDAITHDLPGARSVSNSAAILRYQDQLSRICP
jgi:alanine racemase